MWDCFARSSFKNFFLVKSGMRENFSLCNTESRSLESGIRNPTKDRNPEFQIPLTKTVIQYLKSGVHSVNSEIQDEDGATLSSVASCQRLDLATQLLYKQNM